MISKEDNRTNKKRVYYTIIVAVVILVLLFIKNEYSGILLRHSTYGMPALVEKGHVDNLFIGSSAFRQGLSIDILDDNLYGENYILTYNGNEPYLEYIEINKLIDSGVNIGHIYIDMYAYAVDRAPKLDDEKLLLELSLNEKIKLYNMLEEHSISKWWQMFVSSNNDMLLTWPINKGLVDSIFRNGGALIGSEGLDEHSYQCIIPPYTYGTIDDSQAEAIICTIELCRRNDIELTFVEIPKADAIMDSQEYQAIMEKYAELLDDNNVDFIRADISDMIYSDYSDGIHLSSDGRVKYTEWLVKRI